MTDGTTLVDLDAPAPASSREGRALPWLWIFVGALLIAGVVSAFALQREPEPAERLAAAAEAVDDAGTFSYALTLEGSGGFGATVGIEGSVDPRSGRSTSSLAVRGSTVQLVSDGDVVYVQVPEAAREQLGGKPWVRLDAQAVRSGFGGVAPSATPLETFEQLRQAGKVEEVGREEVRGTGTTHFRAVVDLRDSVPDGPGAASVRDALRAVQVDVWLDDDDRIRRHRTTLDLGGAIGGPSGMGIVTTIETFDFGKAVSIEIPPADQVADVEAGALGSILRSTPAGAGAPTD